MRLFRLAAALGSLALLGASLGSHPGTTLMAWGAEASTKPPLRSDSVLPAAGLQADVAILRHAHESLHPGLLRYNSAAQMDDHFRALEREFQVDRTLAEAYMALSIFATQVKCGHTYPNFYNQSDAVAEALFQEGRVPFHFRWLDRRMIVTRSFADDPHLKPGTEVLAINGTPAVDILEKLLTVARADGNNMAKRISYLEVQGRDRYEAFDIYFPLFFPSASPRMTLRIRTLEGGEPITIEVSPQTAAARLAAMPEAEDSSDPDGAAWSFRMLDPRVGYLRTPTWALYNSKWDWHAFLDTTFAELDQGKATDLIVDVRGNEGGNDVGDVIISHLIAEDVPRQLVQRKVRYRRVPADLVPYLDTWDPSFQDWGEAARDSADGFYSLRRDADDDLGGVIQPAAPRFTGRLWVLVGAANSSATFEFAQTVRQNRLGTLVGQPTGGNQRGINGGCFFFLRLPNSGLEIDLPLIGQFPVGDVSDAGIEPDMLIVPTVDDIAVGRDPEMEAVMKLIADKSR